MAVLSAILTLSLPALLTSCDKESKIGAGLVSDEISVVVDSSFTISSSSVASDAVISRTTTLMLGIIDAPDYGFITSDAVTQFMPANTLDTAGVTVNDVDSLKLYLLINTNSFVGDSLALMGLDVYPLVKQLPSPIYSNFDPQGYYDPSQKIGSAVYNMALTSLPDSLQQYGYHTIPVNLPPDLGRKFFKEYIENPATFASPTAFAKFFPGLYITNSYGSGRISRVGNTTMRMYYHQHTKTEAGNDTVINKIGTYFVVSPEVIVNNDINLTIASEINQKVAHGESILLAPAGLDVEIQFPAEDIISAYRTGTNGSLGVVNTLSFTLPVESIENKYDIAIPQDVLFLLKKDKADFFLKNKLPDDVTSFRATLTTLNDGSLAYVFPDMRQYIANLIDKESVTDDDFTFLLVPITANSETNSDYYGGSTTTLTSVVPYVVEPKMAKVLPEKAKITFVFTRQSTKL